MATAGHVPADSIDSKVRFGVSPAEVWRNKADDPNGSYTQAGAPNFDSLYADTQQWVWENMTTLLLRFTGP